MFGVAVIAVIVCVIVFVQTQKEPFLLHQNSDMPGEIIPDNWADVCREDLTQINRGCIWDNSPFDDCRRMLMQDTPCIQTSYKPTTLTMCHEKYDAYKQNVFGRGPVSFDSYSSGFCDLPE